MSGGINFSSPPTVEDWVAVKASVRQLYVNQQLPLKEVRDVLFEQYGFKASERMIKSRLKTWGYLKNAKKTDWHYLAILHHTRKVQGKPTTVFVVRGHRKTVKDLQRFVRNQGMTLEQFLAEAYRCVGERSIPTYIRATTPETKAQNSPGGTAYDVVTPTSSQGAQTARDHHFLSHCQNELLQPNPLLRTRSTSFSSGELDFSMSPDLSPARWKPGMCDSTYESAQSMTDSCQQVQWDFEVMAQQLVNPAPIQQRIGADDIRSWALLNNSPGSDKSGSSCEFVCSRCNQPSNQHFVSLDAAQPRQSTSRGILNGDDNTLHLPVSTRGEGPWIWVSRCFFASMLLNKGDEEKAQIVLQQAAHEFERLLEKKDRLLLTAAGHTITILHMHNQGAIVKRIMTSAKDVAVRLEQEGNPIRATIEYLEATAIPSEKNGIDSEFLKRVYLQFTSILSKSHPYVITAQYNYAWMLKREDRLDEAEEQAKEAYEASCKVFGAEHLQSITALAVMAGCLSGQDARREECISLYKQVVTEAQSTLGISHPYTLEAVRRMTIKIEERDGTNFETCTLYKGIMVGRLRMLGSTHTFTLGARSDYEKQLKKLERWEESTGLPTAEQQEIEDLFSPRSKSSWTKVRSRRQSSRSQEKDAFLFVDDWDGDNTSDAIEEEDDDQALVKTRSASPASSVEHLAY